MPIATKHMKTLRDIAENQSMTFAPLDRDIPKAVNPNFEIFYDLLNEEVEVRVIEGILFSKDSFQERFDQVCRVEEEWGSMLSSELKEIYDKENSEEPTGA